jgi:hypothetical protein
MADEGRITDPAQIRALHARQKANDDEWSALFDVQYALIEAVQRLLADATRDLPAEHRVAVRCYLVEFLAESARFDIELPLTGKPAVGGSVTATEDKQ